MATLEAHHDQSRMRHGRTFSDVRATAALRFTRALTRLFEDNNIRVQKGDLEKANLTSVPLNDEQGGYLASLDVFHTLHCVNKIRKSYYSDYYHDPNPLADQQEHFDHCVDLLRQVVMCHGDISLHTYEWKDDYRWPWPTMQTEHQCRNWDKLMVWSEDNYIPSLTGPILSHPSLGKSVDARNLRNMRYHILIPR